MAECDSYPIDPSLISSAIDSLAEGVVLLDAEGRLLFVNRAFEEGVGIPRDRLLGKRFDHRVFVIRQTSGESVEPEETPFHRVLVTGEAVLGSEYELEDVNGRKLRAVINAVPVVQGGTLKGVAVTIRDITRRTRAEDALRESEERLEAFFNQLRYGLVISNLKGEVVLYNPAMEAITGHPFEEVRAKGWPAAAYPDPAERAHAMEMAAKSIRGEVSYNEEPYTRADGRRIWLSYAVSPVRLRGEKYVAAIIIDVTERKNAEERARFQSSLLDQVHNAVVASDLQGRITYMNDAAEELYGWDADSVAGSSFIDVVLAQSVDSEARMKHVMEHGQWEGESVMRLASGEEVPVLLTLALIRDSEGRPEGVVGVAGDISEIKNVQRELEFKDVAIRQAYVDVVGAVTGGKLVLMTREELQGVLGIEVLGKVGLRFDTLSESRRLVSEAMERERIVADPREVIVAFGEAATNALKHAGGGHFQVFRTGEALQVLVTDDGSGIDFTLLPHATLMAGYSTKATLGMGFTVMLELADRLLLSTQPGRTELVLEFALR